jgi:hypothetical protein
MKMKFIITCVFFLPYFAISQDSTDCNKNKEQLINLVKREYQNIPVDGAKYVSIGDCKYIIGMGTTSTQSKTNSTMARISSVKARREVLLLLKSASVTSEAILTTEQVITENSSSYFEGFRDKVVEKASAFVKGMPMLTAFSSNDGATFIYVLYKPLP